MAEAYSVFASYLRFEEVLSDPLGHLYRAGEFDASGVRRAVWLRIFDKSAIEATDVIAGFDRVQAIAEAVQSTNVAAGVDCIVDDGTPAIAADFVPSQPLSRVLARVAEEHFPIPVDNALLIVEKIALALCATLTAEVGGERVVHGFLHPGLIFVTNDGEGFVSGFGIGERLMTLIEEQSSADVIRPYLAPEVLESRAASRRGDVYSLGAILFHLLTGAALPAEAGDRTAAIAGAKLAYEDDAVPDDIKTLLKRALTQRPEERFSSAADLKKELDRLLYGGAYSPTTFNLALFMDRLFRSEIEAEEADLARELNTDVAPYLAPVVTSEPVIEPTEAEPAPGRQSLWIGLGVAGAAAIAATLWLTVFSGPSAPPPPPTPTAEEIAAERQAQEEKMRELAEGLVAEMMAQKEEEIRAELVARQEKIDELQQRLVESERRAQQGQLTSEDVRRREELERQIAAEEEAQRQREADLEAQRLEAAEDARQQAAAQQTATAAIEALALGTTTVVASPTPPPAPTLVPTLVPTVLPTAVPTPRPTPVPQRSLAIARNAFVDPNEVDSPPAVIKDVPVVWSRAAILSRRKGAVVLQATVNADGLAEEVKVLEADHEGFGIPQSVKDAVMQYRFKPARKNGVPVKTYHQLVARYDFTGR